MEQNKSVSVRELIPIVFQLRELILPGPDASTYLHATQSSCGGEDT